MFEVTKGKIVRAQRVTFYGPEGIGKSTLASLFPNPLFMDVEQGTHQLDVARTPSPASFEMIRQITADFQRDPQGYQTLVVDTADWTERHAITEVCSTNNLSSLGGAEDYGRSYNLLEETWAKWLDSLTEICMGLGVHIVVLAHAMMRKFEQPEEVGAFDRWEMKLQKKPAAKLKEWSDMLLFASYKTLVVESSKKVKKGTGGARVLRTTHHPCWDAKNRHGLPDEIMLTAENKTTLPIELAGIFFSATHGTPQPTPQTQDTYKEVPVVNEPPLDDGKEETVVAPMTTGIPAALLQLMEASNITEADIRKAVHARGHYPEETPITNYDPKFIDGVLVSAWDKVVAVIEEIKGVQS